MLPVGTIRAVGVPVVAVGRVVALLVVGSAPDIVSPAVVGIVFLPVELVVGRMRFAVLPVMLPVGTIRAVGVPVVAVGRVVALLVVGRAPDLVSPAVVGIVFLPVELVVGRMRFAVLSVVVAVGTAV